MKIRKLRPEMAHSKRIKFLKSQLTQKRAPHKLRVSSHHVTYFCKFNYTLVYLHCTDGLSRSMVVGFLGLFEKKVSMLSVLASQLRSICHLVFIARTSERHFTWNFCERPAQRLKMALVVDLLDTKSQEMTPETRKPPKMMEAMHLFSPIIFVATLVMVR